MSLTAINRFLINLYEFLSFFIQFEGIVFCLVLPSPHARRALANGDLYSRQINHNVIGTNQSGIIHWNILNTFLTFLIQMLSNTSFIIILIQYLIEITSVFC